MVCAEATAGLETFRAMPDQANKALLGPQLPDTQRLRLVSYNIQTGVDTFRYRHYLTHSWKHFLPSARRFHNLDRISELLRSYDLVGLQEVDGGSLRSGFVDQTKYLAVHAGFPYWHSQTTRKLGKVAQHSNGLLTRIRPREIIEHRLPGLPGRGALVAHFGHGDQALVLIILHLALGRRARFRQLAYISELANRYPHVALMGDLNCQPDSPEMRLLVTHTELSEPAGSLPTFPSWRPHRELDHILVSPSLTINEVRVLNYPFSDHLPIAMEISLPRELRVIKERPAFRRAPVYLNARDVLDLQAPAVPKNHE